VPDWETGHPDYFGEEPGLNLLAARIRGCQKWLPRLAIFPERYDGSDARLEKRSREWMTSRIAGQISAKLEE
jgi:hypothetical protein